MKKFVKLFAIVLAIMMVMAIFAACNKKTDDPENTDKPVDNTPVDDNPTPDEPAHEHAWGEGEVTKEPTCTEAGEKTFTCACGETKTEEIAALGHTWDEGTVTKEATIEAEGEKTLTCTVCGETKVEAIEKLPTPTEAPEFINGADARYQSNGDFTYTYLYYTGDEEATELVIPATINGFKVVAISKSGDVLSSPAQFTKITISEGIKTIGASAFEGCTGITEIVIPDSVTEIGENAFKGCTSLRSVKLGAGTEEIPANTFRNCSKIEVVDLGDGLTSLDGATFFDASLTLVKVIIGKNMVDLKDSFDGAVEYGKLVVIENNSESPDFTADTNVKAVLTNIADAKEKGVDVRIEIDENGYVFYFDENGEAALMSYIGGGQKKDPYDDDEIIDSLKKVLVLPKSAGEAELTYKIYRYAFNGRTDIAKVVFSEGVTAIDEYAFAVTALQELNLPKSVTKIGLGIASYCKPLTVITVADGNTVFSAAGNCLIETAKKTVVAGCKASVIPTDSAKVTKIGANAFEGASFTEITIPANVTAIAKEAFYGCAALANVRFKGTPSIAEDAFTATALTITKTNFDNEMYLKDSETGNLYFALLKVEYGTCVINPNTKVIAETAFSSSTSYTAITLPGSLTGNALVPKDNLTTVIISDGVVAADAFDGCTGLKNLTLNEGVTEIGKNAFHDTGLIALTIPTTVTKIGECAFNTCDVTTVTIPATVTTLGRSVFANCTKLTSATVNTTAVSDELFIGCTKLATVVLADTVASVGEDAFDGCPVTTLTYPIAAHSALFASTTKFVKGNLETVTINGTTAIPDDAFKACSALESVTINAGITAIGQEAFSGCFVLKTVNIPASVTTIKYGAFYTAGNDGSDEFVVNFATGSQLATLEESAFLECDNLKSISLPATLTTIGNRGLEGCDALTAITYAGTTTEWAAVTTGTDWNKNTGAYTIHCTDGDIAKA